MDDVHWHEVLRQANEMILYITKQAMLSLVSRPQDESGSAQYGQ
jgi:hypothetical protein